MLLLLHAIEHKTLISHAALLLLQNMPKSICDILSKGYLDYIKEMQLNSAIPIILHAYDDVDILPILT